MVTPLMIQIADFLNTIIISNSFLFINFWSFGHLLFGAVLMYLFLINKKDRFLKLFWLLVLYEIFEILVTAYGSSLFRAESGIDILYDILVGLVGGWLAIKFK